MRKLGGLIHWRDVCLFVNAGMRFPACYANARPLDTDKSRLMTSADVRTVECKRCQRLMVSKA